MTTQDPPALRWLQLTDLHFGINNESQKTALRSLLSSVEQFSRGIAFDIVMITGDLAYAGKQEQYAALATDFFSGLRSHELLRDAKFVSVPGNHDLDCEVEFPPSWKELGVSRQDKFFHLGDDGKRVRGSRARAFDEYQRFVSQAGILSVDPTLEPARLIRLTTRARPISIISTVTSFFSDKEVADRQKAPAPVHAIRTLMQDVGGDELVIVLGHHPAEWFLPESEQHLYSLLIERNAVYLHGHEHRLYSKFGPRGLTCLGFGAAYQASMDSSPVPFYRNSFAICELTDSLHVFVASWDAEHGQWRPESRLPSDFVDRSDRLSDAYVLSLPTTRVRDRARPFASISAAIRQELEIERCIWLAENDPKRWSELLRAIGIVRDISDVYSTATISLPPGHLQFRLKDGQDQYLVHAISAHGDILSYEQLQTINTELDRQSFDACIVATLGVLSQDAKTLATQLSSRKQIKIFERTDLIRLAIRNLPAGLERALFSAANVDNLGGCLIVTPRGFALLVKERVTNAWFSLLDEEGESLLESHELVVKVRREQPALNSWRYDGASRRQDENVASTGVVPTFQREAYLRACHDHFDEVKYAPLAALGFRFRKASLSGIYVEASADVGGATKSTENLTRVVSEFVGSLNLPEAQRHQLEAQLRSRYGLNRSAEVGAARKLCQRYNNVVVLGDPGSGKTCFVKYEILAYCTPPDDTSTWYSRHLPIYVSLAEAARLLDDGLTLIEICEVVSSRRGIELPRKIIEEAMSDGQAAFFFDGLDEVGYIDKRIALVAAINQLVKSFASRGNRFVITSRPAAIQPVDIPEGLTFLHLKGLTEQEIRTLAGRVLTFRLGEGGNEQLDLDENELIDRLLEDTRNQPGIARIARNPLLLTLLVLIYAGSGALSARRHVIYTQAIKTLVSVRGRETREQQISEADLRTRLGALALAIFRRDIAEIPSRSEVSDVLVPILAATTASSGKPPDRTDSDLFIQEVAEATGLLSIHASESGRSEDLVTFMHYSFLEYYVAAGLIAHSQLELIPSLSGIPRWKDVITLLFGMLSEQSDVTPLLTQILASSALDEAILKSRTLLALDCASECDVPPERSQVLLADALFEAIANGPGRYSPELRADLARRLESLLTGAGSRIESRIIEGLNSRDPICAAAFLDLVARITEEIRFDERLIAAFEKCLDHENPVTRAAAMYTIERHPDFRTDKAIRVVRETLSGSLVEKHAALKVVASVQSISEMLRNELRERLDDQNALISTAAAQCLLVDVLRRPREPGDAGLVEKILQKLQQESDEETGLALQGVTIDRESITSLVRSVDVRERELAIRHIPLMKGDGQFVHDLLMEQLRTSDDVDIRAACLNSLRSSAEAIALITLADTDLICAELRNGRRHVRIAAIRLMGELPDDEQVVQGLQNHMRGVVGGAEEGEELTQLARALARHVGRNQRLRLSTLTSLLERLPKRPRSGFGSDAEQKHLLALLSICESIGGVTDEATAWRLFKIADDFRTPIEIRKQAMRVFGRIVEPSEKSISRIVKLLKRDDPRFNDATYSAASAFLWQCRRKVEHVRRVYGDLKEMRDVLCEAWRREVSRTQESINPPGLRDLRDSVATVVTLIISYEEFAERARLA